MVNSKVSWREPWLVDEDPYYQHDEQHEHHQHLHDEKDFRYHTLQVLMLLGHLYTYDVLFAVHAYKIEH